MKLHLNSSRSSLLCIGLLALMSRGSFVDSAWGAVSLKIIEPRCEYLVEPLGLDVVRPRLSWKLEARDPQARGQRQTQYHILVASTKELMQKNKADLWDSGTVQSDESVNVPYAGKSLESGQKCFWKVQVADDHGVLSAWSIPAGWTMGLMDAADWKAQWIGTDQESGKGPGTPRSKNNPPDPW